jgi:hypothetical protein
LNCQLAAADNVRGPLRGRYSFSEDTYNVFRAQTLGHSRCREDGISNPLSGSHRAYRNADLGIEAISKPGTAAESVLVSAVRMVHNQSAIVNLANGLDGDLVAADKALAELSEAAIAVATEHGMPDFVRLARRL